MALTSRRRTPSRVAVLLAAAAVTGARGAGADTLNYIGVNGLWSDPTVWDDAGTQTTPTDYDTVNLVYNGPSAAVLTYDATAYNAFLNSVTIDYTGASTGGSMTLLQTGNNFTTGSEYVGNNGAGALTLNAGNHYVGGTDANALYVGFNAGSSGTVTLGSAATLSVSGLTYIGYNGAGAFNQIGGAHTSSSLTLGANLGSTGSYSLASNAASLMVNGAEVVGDGGAGRFTQTGGSHTASSLGIGNSSTGNGTFTLSGGTASFYDVAVGGGPYSGQGGLGSLVINGIGSFTATNSLSVYSGGTVTLAGGTMTLSYFNYSAPAPISWTRGTLNVTANSPFTLGAGTPLGNAVSIGNLKQLNLVGSLIVPAGASLALSGGTISTPSLDLSAAPTGFLWTAGSLNLTSTNGVVFDTGENFGASMKLGAGQALTVGGPVTVGRIGAASFNQSGGTHSARSLDLGANAGAYGQYTLSNAATLTISNKAYIGDGGQGLLNQTGGTVNVNNGQNAVYLGYQAGSSGTVNISGNNSVFNSSDVFIGYTGNGVFNQSGGVHALTGFLVLGGHEDGSGSNAIGVYNLTNGQLNANTLYAGLSGTGTFNQSAGGVTLGGLTAGYLAGSTGTVNLSVNANVFDAGQVIIGDSGNGTLVQSGGSQLNAGLTLGNSSGGSGTMRLSGGTITVDGVSIIGNNGTGNVIQTGGTHAPSNLYISLSSAGAGSYTLNGGVLHPTSSSSGGFTYNGSEYIGYYGPATFNQTGGSHIVDSYMVLARAFGSSATYNLSGGTLSSPAQSIGYQSTANNVFNQTGGANAASSYLTVGDQGGARGTYNLSGSNSTLSVNFLFDSYAGLGTFNQSGGTANVSALFVAHESSATSSYNLSGGTLKTSVSEDIGYGGNGTFNQTGGIHLVSPTATVTLSGQSTGVGTYNLSAGSFTAGPVVNNGTINLSGGTATFAALSGVGNTTLTGTSAVATRLTVNSFGQNSLSIGNNTSVTVLPNATARLANSATSLSIAGSGQLDLANHSLLTTTTNNLRSYIVQAAGPVLPGKGLNGWTGAGLTSSLVKADAANGNAKQLAVGYFDSRDNAQTGLSVPTGKTLVQYTVYGDATGDSKVDIADLSVWNNNFGAGNRWSQGDWNYDGRVDISDLSVWNNDFGNQLSGGTIKPGATVAAAATARPTLTSSSASAFAAASSAATPLPATLELDVNTATGDATLNSGGVTLAAIELDSASGILIKSGWQSLRLGHGFNQWSFPRGTPSATSLSEYTSDASSASGQPATLAAGTLTDYGLIFPVGFSDPTDLTFKYNIADPTTGLTAPRTGTVVFTSGVPEPTCLALCGVAAMGLLGRKRRR